MGNYKGNNQKDLAFHTEAKQKNYKEEKKLRKPYEAPPLLLYACVLFCSKDLGKILSLDFVNRFQLSRILVFCKRFASNSIL